MLLCMRNVSRKFWLLIMKHIMLLYMKVGKVYYIATKNINYDLFIRNEKFRFPKIIKPLP